MDESFYGLDGKEPWEVEWDLHSVVGHVIRAHLFYVTGELRSDAKDILDINISVGERNIYKDIVYNVEKWCEAMGVLI